MKRSLRQRNGRIRNNKLIAYDRMLNDLATKPEPNFLNNKLIIKIFSSQRAIRLPATAIPHWGRHHLDQQ